jgi:hypothetical protein
MLPVKQRETTAQYTNIKGVAAMRHLHIVGQGCFRPMVAGVGLLVLAAAVSLSAQVTSVKLPTADSSASFQVLDSGSVTKLRVNGDGGFVAGGTYGIGVIPATGAGARLMWYPRKAAFRVGAVDGAQWDDANIGQYSTAMGYRVMARGAYSAAIGFNCNANARYASAIGYGAEASGNGSTAMGFSTTASKEGSTAMGYYTTASDTASIAMGYYTTASGFASTAMGDSTIASGAFSTAMGNYVSTNLFAGSFVIGDNSTATTNVSTASNQMMMRFAGGYRLFTDAAATMGVSLAAGASSWGTISDSTKKTNFIKANQDYFLSSLSKLKLGSWNYKSQDAKNYRHYGPMAQEIFHYFGHDGKGTIGCDTLLASADMDGIMMICLQALEKRTSELQKANDKITELQQQVNEQNGAVQNSREQIAEHEARILSLETKIEQLSKLVSSSTKNREQLSLNTPTSKE